MKSLFCGTRPWLDFGRQALNGSSGGEQSGSCNNLSLIKKRQVNHAGLRMTLLRCPKLRD